MSKTLRGRLLAAIFCAGAAAAYSAPASAETLADAIALAYDTNPNLQAQRSTQRALDETYVQARTGSGDYSNQVRSIGDAPPTGTQARFINAQTGSGDLTIRYAG